MRMELQSNDSQPFTLTHWGSVSNRGADIQLIYNTTPQMEKPMKSNNWEWIDGPFTDSVCPLEPPYFSSDYLTDEDIRKAAFEHITSRLKQTHLHESAQAWTTYHLSKDGIEFRVSTCTRSGVACVVLVSPHSQ